MLHTTETYQLNQWERADRLLMEDFNRDNVRTEEALKSLAAQVAQRATQAALEALRQETATATASVRGEVAAAAAAVRTEVAAATAAVRSEAAAATAAARAETAAANQLVKLLEVTTSTAAAQVDVDLSKIRPAEYAELLVIPRLSAPSGAYIEMRPNNLRVRDYYNDRGSSNDYMARFLPDSTILLRLYLFHGLVCSSCTSLPTAQTGDISLVRLVKAHLVPKNLTFISFSSAAGELIAAGGKFTIYGVKL